MRLPLRVACAFGALTLSVLVGPAVPAARAAVVVISEFATRGPSAATDEFVELHNPTASAIDISGWKLQYKSASGTIWNDRATLPANSFVPAHGFFLLANQDYVGSVTPDYQSGTWGSGQGMADNGHERILDASSVEIDKVGWGTAIDPEGGVAAPNHGTSANGNSVERKATATSTAASLASGGADELLGNGRDSNVNGSDFVTQTNGRHPQNSANPPEPVFASGGNGTGRATPQPSVVFTGQTLDLDVTFKQDSAYTITKIAMTVPTTWTWSHLVSSVALSGPAFQTATASVVAESIFVDSAALTMADTGTVTILGATSPSAPGNTTFDVRTAVAAGTLTQIAQQPRVRVLDLVPIVVVHVNNASGVPTAPYAVGSEATVTGIVTVNYSATQTNIYLQDVTAGINLFSFTPPAFTIAEGDSLTVTGSILQFRGLTELQPDPALLTLNATGRPVPAPMVVTCADVNATFHADGTEPNESRLVRVNGVTYNSAASTITDASGTTGVFIPSTYPPTPAVFDLVGILKQFKPGTSPPPPYTADYEITPRTPADIIAHPGPIITSAPYEDMIQPTSVRLNWTTNVASSSIVAYGTTPALGDTATDATPVTTHGSTVTGLSPATVYYYSVGSGDVNGTNFSPTDVFCTASPLATTGETNVYFNKSVNTSLAWITPANGNQDLTSRLVTRIDNSKRSIDGAIYNLSGTPGSSIASALVAAKNRGVKVRVICEYDNQSNAPFSTIASSGIPLINDRFDAINNGMGLMHDKFLVIDGRGGAPDSVWVWTGSWNPTTAGTDDDYQNSIEIQDLALATVYTAEFNEMWGSSTDVPNASNSRFGARKLDDTPHRFVIAGHDVECYFSPSDDATSKIIAAMNAAQYSIGFQLLTMTRADISAAIVARKTAGLSVRGDLDNNTDTGSQYSYLVTNGVDVRLKTGSGLLHHKYCLFDAERPASSPATLTGSHNWSNAAENSNNENTVVVHDPDVTNQYLQEFAARYYQFGGVDSIHTVAVDPVGWNPSGTVSLAQNVPNPFERRTRIAYALPSRQKVVLELYDVAGRQVRTLVNGTQAPGIHRVDLNTGGLSSGVYFYRLTTERFIRQRKMLLLR